MMTVSTTLTCIRIALAPVFGLLVYEGLWPFAAIVFLAAISTDILDGYIARKRDETTPTGALLDAAADKIFVACAIVAVYLAFDLPWHVLLVLTRDVLVGIGSLILLGMSNPERRIDLSSDWSGKTVTALQIITISAIFISKVVTPIRESFIDLLVFLTAVIGLLCSIYYLLRAKRRGYI